MSQKQPITDSLVQAFIWSFVVCIGSAATLFVVADVAEESTRVDALFTILALLWLGSAITWYISLGTLASRLGRWWFVWIGLSVITNPVGPFVAFALMRGHIRQARKGLTARVATHTDTASKR